VAADPRIHVDVYLQGSLVRQEKHEPGILNLGKLSTSSIRLDDINVSRKHAVIEHRGNGEWRLTDLGSTNGTLVNGKRLVQATLKHGDRIEMGTSLLVVGIGAETPKDAATSHAQRGAAKTGEAPSVQAALGGPTASPDRPTPETEGLSGVRRIKRGPASAKTVPALEIAQVWGDTVLSVQQYYRPEPVWIGELPQCRFPVPAEVLGTSKLQLVGPLRGKFALNLRTDHLRGEVLYPDGQVKRLKDIAKESRGYLLLEEGMRARLRVGEFRLLCSYAPVPVKQAAFTGNTVELWPWIFVALSAIFHIGLMIVFANSIAEDMKYRLDPSERRSKLLQIIKISAAEAEKKKEEEQKDPEKQEEEKKQREKLKAEEQRTASQAQPARPNERRPKPKELEPNQNRKLKDDLANLSEADRKKRSEEIAAGAGAAKIFNERQDLLDDLLSPDDANPQNGRRITGLSTTGGSDDAFAGGPSAIDPFGGSLADPNDGGYTSTSTGGADPGTDGSKGPAIEGLDKGGPGKNLADVALDKGPIKANPIAGNPTLGGSGKLDKETVHKYIRRQMSGIKWCYQTALQANPTLTGKLTLSFTILPTGKVATPEVVQSSISDSDLNACVKQKMGAWRFPQPKEGGVVKVSYPLVLRAQ
jgi:outer membrane biosynthesis protein TonB